MEIQKGQIVVMGRTNPLDSFEVQGLYKDIDSAREDLGNPILSEGEYLLLEVVDSVSISEEMVQEALLEGGKTPTFRALLITFKEEILSEIRSSKGKD